MEYKLLSCFSITAALKNWVLALQKNEEIFNEKLHFLCSVGVL